MNFKQMLSAFIGSEVEVMVPGELIDGELLTVSQSAITVKIAPIIYGPPGDTAVIPLRSVVFVRIVS